MGRDVLIHPRQVVGVQAPAAGCLATLTVQVGDVVRQGDVLGPMDQAKIRQQLRDQRTQLQELLAQDEAKSALQAQQATLQRQQTTLEAHAIQQRDDALKRRRDAQVKAPASQAAPWTTARKPSSPRAWPGCG
jgi:multidrug efflux pump subunit AcrA (membrane-fusion protein)